MSLSIQIPDCVPVVSNRISITPEEGRPFVIVRGPNGCGKSTLLKLMIGLIEGNGAPFIQDGNNRYYPAENRGLIRYMPQVPEEGLFSRLSVRDNVTLLEDLLGIDDLNLEEVCRAINAKPSLAAFKLSVGQQKTLLLMAIDKSLPQVDSMGGSPLIILLDEPLAGLDPKKRLETCELLVDRAKGYQKSSDIVFVLVDHSSIDPIDAGTATTQEIRDKVSFDFIPAVSIALKKT